MVYPIPDQKSQRIPRILGDEVIPLFGVPDALLSDQGANLLSHLMIDLCKLLGLKKLNTTAYHPQCNGMVERFIEVYASYTCWQIRAGVGSVSPRCFVGI